MSAQKSIQTRFQGCPFQPNAVDSAIQWIQNTKRNMADMELRTSSLRLRFEREDPEPTDADIFSFMKDKMALKCDTLLSMYKEKNEMSVIIKFKKDEDAQRTLMRLPNIMEFRYNKYQSANVKLSMANAIMRYVRLFNLPPEVEDVEIQKVMAKYGKVVRMVREKYAEETGFPIWTSVRGMYIELKDGAEIPGTVMIRGMRARIFYEGLVSKCYQCGSTDHMKAECPQRKTVNDRLQVAGPSSYSEALSGGGRWVKKREQVHNAVSASGGGAQSGEQLHFTSLPVVVTNNHASSSTGPASAAIANVDGGEEPKINRTVTLSQRQAMESEKRVRRTEASSANRTDNTGKTTSGEPCGSASSTRGADAVSAEETPSVPTTETNEQWKQKTKRGRKHAAKGKDRKESESEHSTTESDHQMDSRGQPGCGEKGVTTRNKAKQQKRCKVGETSDIPDASHYSENSSQVEMLE